jgi:hypothetical protein
MRTARQLADLVREAQQETWESFDPTPSILAVDKLGPEDEFTVRRITAANGFAGKELDSMSRRVSAMLVGQVGAMADSGPASGGD